MDAIARVTVTRMRALAALALSALALGSLMFLPSVAGATQPGDNGRIAFSSDRDGGNIDIYTMNPDGSGVVQLTDDAFDDWNSSWSPDGNKIAFVSTRAGGTHQVYVMNADGTSVTHSLTAPATTRRLPGHRTERRSPSPPDVTVTTTSTR